MTGSLTSCSVLGAAMLTVANAVTSTPTIDSLMTPASVVSVMSIFLWRETKKNEELEKEREARRVAEHKCSSCQFVVEANEQFISKNK